MPKRPIWSGSIAFGLVNIPVRLFNAISEDRVSFHLLHDQDHQRLHRQMVCPADGKQVHPEHIVRGYEVDDGTFVVVRDEELESCAPQKSRAIDISDFVELGDIDPIYFDRPYYVLPQAGAGKSYRLLVEAMRRAKKVGIARFVLHDKEHLAALRVVDDAILLETMHFGDEVLSPERAVDGTGVAAHAKVGDKEVKVAEQLVESLASKWKPSKYRDDYKEQVIKLVQKKERGEEVVTSHPPDEEGKKPKTARATDLMAALEASLVAAKKGSSASSSSHRPRRKSA